MKNFKKVLALVLALATLLSFATIAGAKVDTTAIYADADDVKYVEAVDVLTAIGVLNGKGASYKPNDTLKRSEAAKIIAMFDNGDTDISSLYNPANTFVDVAKDYWAISYIAYCAKQGIISGVGNNKYAPESKLTGIQFLKMVLVTLGYDAKEEGLVGTSWKVNVLKLARAAGLTDVLGKKYDYDKELTRDAAAQIMLNALNAKTVSYGQEIKTSGKKNVLTTAGAIENASYLYESWKLTKKENQADDFGRPCHVWKLGKDEIGTYTDAALATYQTAVSGCDIIADCDFDDDGVELVKYEDGTEVTKKLSIKNTTKVEYGGQGVLTEVYEDRIVFINTYLGKVTKVVTEKEDAKGHVIRKAETTVKVWATVPTTDRFTKPTAGWTETTFKFESDSFAKDDMVLVTLGKNVTLANKAVETAVVAESKIAEFSKIKKVDGTYSQIALDGEYVDIAEKYVYDGISTGDLGNDMIAYYDAYGNVIGMEKYYAPLNYAVIDALWIESVKGKPVIKADLWTIGGDELEEVTVSKVASVTVSGTTFDFDADKVVKAIGTAASDKWNAFTFATNKFTKDTFYNKLMAYTTDDDGNYTLSMAWDSTVYGAIQPTAGPLTPATFSNGSAYVKVNNSIEIQMTDETVVLVQNTDTSAPYATYTSYTGYDNVPSMTGKVWYHLDQDTKKADVIYVYDVSVTGTETVIFYKGDVRASGAMKNGKYPIDFVAYALDKDTGSLTEQTYTYKANATNALAGAATGFYTVYVNDKNELTFKGITAGAAVTTPDATSAANYASTKVGSVLQVMTKAASGSDPAEYLVIDGGSKDITAYTLSGIEALDYDKVEAGDFLYVYKNKDNGKFTIVDAVDVANVLFVNAAGTEVKGTATEETIGHKWEAMTIASIEAGYLKTGFDVYGYATEADRTAAKASPQAADKVANPGEDGTDATPKTVAPYLLIVVADDPTYTTLGLNAADVLGGWGEVTTAPAITPTEGVITLKVGTVVKASQIAADVAGKIAANNSNATVAVYSANGVMADADATLIANKTAGDNYSTWYLMLTAKNGVSVKVTFVLP